MSNFLVKFEKLAPQVKLALILICWFVAPPLVFLFLTLFSYKKISNNILKIISIFTFAILTLISSYFYPSLLKMYLEPNKSWPQETSISEVENFQQNTEKSQNQYQVIDVVDGDTFKVIVNGKIDTVRFIAIDTPELSHPTKPVQCFASEAKLYLETLLLNKQVILVNEPKDKDRDQYGRLLRYVFLEDGTHVNDLLVKNGYAIEKTYVEGYMYQSLFKDSLVYAQENKLGMWNESTCNGNPNMYPLAPLDSESQDVKGLDTSQFVCNCSKKCSQINYCEEAYFQLEKCGCLERDDNKDGIPCESICRK